MAADRVATPDDIQALKARIGATIDAWAAELPADEDQPDVPSTLQPPSAVKVVVREGSVTLSWGKPLSGPLPDDYEFDRDGYDATNYGPWSGAGKALSVTFAKLKPVEYRFRVRSRAGTTVSDWVSVKATPKTPGLPPIDPPSPGGRSVKLIGHSGLPFNTIIFNKGSADQAGMTSAAPNLGIRSFDGGLAFATRDRGWAAAKDDALAVEIKGILDAGGIFVLSLPHSMDGDARMNERGAANAYKDAQIDFGRWLVSKGLNREGLILRVDWEPNGGWYHWTAAAPGGPTALKGAMKNFIDNLRAGGLNKAKFDLSLNMASQASTVAWADLWLGAGYFSYFTIDGYDAYPAIRSDADWERKQSDVHSIRGALVQAARFSTDAWPVMGGQDEGGNWHGPDGAGDNPYYWVCLFRELMKTPGRVCWLNIYNDNGAPANLFHGFDSNPNAFTKVREIVAGLVKS